MIQNKRGKIVSISSMGAKVTMPILSVYSATKYGVDGFMESMFDELCIDGYDDCIKLTTVYPYFMYTSKDVECILNKLKDPYPRNLPEKVAQITVKGVLEGKRKIYILPTYFYLFIQ
jgi:all-trans-retinol dehydrogenase (NAD+)